MDIMQVIKEQIEGNPVILYMKGTPQFPQCGFSARAVEVMTSIGQPFAYVNILEAPEIRANLPKYGNWPTFPQLWVKGELVGGSDILLEMHRNGQLGPMIEAVAAPQQDA
jgi:monothiol glutaredoxin